MNQSNMMENKIKLSVIVLFYFGERWIRECIHSLEKQSLPRAAYEIILVDNGGSTPSVANYDSRPHTKVMRFSKNLGFAGGNNRALENAEGEFILLMNQDVIVHFECLEELIAAFESYSNAGVISANMLMIYSGDHINRYDFVAQTVGYYKLTRFGYASYSIKNIDKDMMPVDVVSGNAMCFRRCMLTDVGNYLFDERLKSYAEDLDLSMRLQKTKWDMYLRTKAVVYHYRDEAFSGNPLKQIKKLIHVSSNRLCVYYNNLPIAKFIIKLPALLCGIPFKVSRQEGDSTFQPVKFAAALIMAPFIFMYFCLRLYPITKTSKTKSAQN
jgi:GT2 family glycosyltransferase